MVSQLQPTLVGSLLTVDQALQQPARIERRIADQADKQLIVETFFTPFGSKVTGGSILFNQVTAKERFLAADVSERADGAEYPVVEGVDPQFKLANVTDWGGKFPTTDAQIDRNEVSYLQLNTDQLANTIVRKVNRAAFAAIDKALDDLGGAADLVGKNWDNVVISGPEASLTPSKLRPTDDFAAAQLSADLDELGIVFDTLLVAPSQAYALRSAYEDKLLAVLTAYGITLKSSKFVTAGKGYLVQKGAAGKVGFERPLTVDVWDDRSIRSKWTQAYAVPAFAVEQPLAIRRLNGLGA